MRRALALLGLCLGPLAAPAWGQLDAAEALFRLGRQLLSEGKTSQGLQKLEESIRAAPQGPFADDALLALAAIDYPAASLEDLGKADAAGFSKARVRLEKIAKEYRAANTAPTALFRLGLLQMDPAGPRASLDEAYATFLQLERLYPGSAEAPDAIEAAGTCLLMQGERDAAAGEDARLVVEHEKQPAAKRARLRLAVAAARSGETALAHRLLGSVMDGEGASSGRSSTQPSADVVQAKQIAYLLLRAADDRVDRPGSRSLDESFAPPAPEDIVSLSLSREGTVWALEEDSGRVLSMGAGTASAAPGEAVKGGEATKGRSEASELFERSRGFCWDQRGAIVRWEEKGLILADGRRVELRGPAEKQGEPGEPLKKISAVAIGRFGEIDVLDGAGSRLLRYGPDRSLRGDAVTFESRPTVLVRADDGTDLVLIPSRREIHIVPPPGATRARRSVLPLRGQGWELTSPEAIALDLLGRIYVLDGSSKSVTILDAEGRRVAHVAPARGSAGELKDPAAIAVDRAGYIYVADRRPARILRFK